MEHLPHHDFSDVLAEQLRRAPYVLASLVAHVMLLMLVAGMMLLQREETEAPTVLAQAAPPPPLIDEDPPPDDPPPPVPVETIEPQVVPTEVLADALDLIEKGDPEQNAKSPFDSLSDNAVIGVGGPPGGMKGGPGGPGSGGPPRATEAAVQDALRWLADHQTPSGLWDADAFMHWDVHADKPASTGPGNPVVDVGLTGLALLAFEANGNSPSEGAYADRVARGVNWLKSVQRDDGLFGDEVGNPTLYNHAIATMAVGEAYWMTRRSPLLKSSLQDATGLILNARNDYGAWRYRLEPTGDNDSSITGWMVFALKTAEAGGIAVDAGAWRGAEDWLASMEDKSTGRVGYVWEAGPGSLPSRPAHLVDAFPAERSEALTAVALLSRVFMTDGDSVRRWEDHPQYESLRRQADLVRAKLPRWDESDGSIDLYYWYYGTFAMNQWGGKHWRDWERALRDALLPNQRREDSADNHFGSWDPAGAWGEEGGRVYSTALCALMLEVYYRYARVLGAR